MPFSHPSFCLTTPSYTSQLIPFLSLTYLVHSPKRGKDAISELCDHCSDFPKQNPVYCGQLRRCRATRANVKNFPRRHSMRWCKSSQHFSCFIISRSHIIWGSNSEVPKTMYKRMSIYQSKLADSPNSILSSRGYHPR